jgi:hypothetical protein
MEIRRRGEAFSRKIPKPDEVPSRQLADLVVFDKAKPRGVFEFKWWNLDTAPVKKAIKGDIEKLRTWKRSSPDLFLVAVWWAPKGDDHRRKYEGVVDEFLGRLSPPAKRIRSGYFDTHIIEKGVGEGQHEFAVALIRV